MFSSRNQMRSQLNSTPIRSRPAVPPTYQNTIQKNVQAVTDRNPNDSTVVYRDTRTEVSPNQRQKPTLNIPYVSTPKKVISCANHQTKQAEFQIDLEDDRLFYCQKCSALLASQGFQVKRLDSKVNSADQSTGSHMSAQRLQNHERYVEIRDFCDNAKALIVEYDENNEFLRGLQTHYMQQEQLIQQFHNGMIDYMERIKQQHLKMLRSESRKYLQIADIERGEIEDNSKEINDIINDIENNMTDIVMTLSEDRYREVMNLYQQKINIFTHQAEQQRQSMEGITNVDRKDLQKKLMEFGHLVSKFFSAPDQERKMCVENEKLIRLANLAESKKKGPFRNLRFEQSDMMESPVFRQI